MRQCRHLQFWSHNYIVAKYFTIGERLCNGKSLETYTYTLFDF